MPAPVDARARHYAAFYGLDPLADPSEDRRPLAIVHGNCQAESLRIVLDGGGLATIRIPPVHELIASDLPHLRRVLARTRVLISQPVRDGYRDLPLGTAELAAHLPPDAQLARVPVIRFAGLYPVHAIVRPPRDPSLQPPLVEYHDLRVLAEAAGAPRSTQEPTPKQVQAIAADSIAALRTREEAHETVAISDVFARPDFAQMRTLNHPGNPIWLELAARVRARLGLAEHVTDPGRPLLDHVHAPRLAAVVEAFELPDPPRADWILGGEAIPAQAVREAHLAFYAAHPDVVAAGLERHAAALRALELVAA